MFKQQETKKPDEALTNENVNSSVLTNDENNQKKVEPKNPDDIDLKAKIEYSDNHLLDIENGRKEFLAVVKKQNIFKWLTASISIGLLIFSWIYLVGQAVHKPLGYGLIAVSVAMLLSYYFITKKVNGKKMGEYLKRYYGDMNAFVFGQESFSDVNGNIQGKIANAEFTNCGIYKNVSTIGSRNIVNFKIDGKYDCKMCDCAAQMSTTRQLEPLFIGKYIIASNSYHEEEPIVVYLTGNSRALPPNNVEQLPKAVNTRKMIIYTQNKNYESALNSTVREQINKLITNNVLVDTFIVIAKETTYIGLGYDDCLMVLPLQQQFNPRPIEKFKSDMSIISKIIAGLNK